MRPLHVNTLRDFDHWRATARLLLNRGVAPDDVHWHGDARQTALFGDDVCTSGFADKTTQDDSGDAPRLRVPREFPDLARAIACHRDSSRWSLLYRVLYRLTHEEPHLLQVATDDDTRRCRMMAKAVHRDSHKMKAFVRFRRVAQEDGGEVFVAWHRPDHFIVECMAPWFAARFGAMRWSILTPDASAHWDMRALKFGAGVTRDLAPTDDELESLWLTYYAAIFNPARLMTRAMVKEMPVRHWQTLPETRLIPDLIRRAEVRTTQMRETQREGAAPFLPPPERRSLSALAEAIEDCRGCELYCAATRAVFGEGKAGARVMFVGEQPGDAEDRAGRPFVGAAGQLLDEAMREAGVRRERIYVTNAVKHFKYVLRGELRQHRNPDASEVAACQPWLDAEIGQVQPRLIVCLGATAALSVLGVRLKILEHRGRFFAHHRAAQVFVTVHPSFVLRQPNAELQQAEFRRFVTDLRLVGGWIKRDVATHSHAAPPLSVVHDEQLTTTRRLPAGGGSA